MKASDLSMEQILPYDINNTLWSSDESLKQHLNISAVIEILIYWINLGSFLAHVTLYGLTLSDTFVLNTIFITTKWRLINRCEAESAKFVLLLWEKGGRVSKIGSTALLPQIPKWNEHKKKKKNMSQCTFPLLWQSSPRIPRQFCSLTRTVWHLERATCLVVQSAWVKCGQCYVHITSKWVLLLAAVS